MHQYLDSDGSGTSDVCVSNTIGASRLAAATAWLQQTGIKGFLGEMGAGSNTACIQAVFGAICSMVQTDVWIGFSWWWVYNIFTLRFLLSLYWCYYEGLLDHGGGKFNSFYGYFSSFWCVPRTYFQSIEPPSGAAISSILPQALKPFLWIWS